MKRQLSGKQPASRRQKRAWSAVHRTLVSDPEKQKERDAIYFSQQLTEEERSRRIDSINEIFNDIRARRNNLPLMGTLNDVTNLLVTYRGDVGASLMIIGEGPGKEESEHGKPFIGPSGKLLDTYLKNEGIDVDKHIYVTNIVPVRPTHQGKNRQPTWEEVNAFIPYLRRQISVVKPKVILCMGAAASIIVSSGVVLNDTSTKGPESIRIPGAHDISLPVLNYIYTSGKNTSTLLLHRERLACRTYASYHPSFLLRKKDKTDKAFSRWKNDFETCVQLLKEAPLQYIRADEVIAEHIDNNFKYCSPDDVFFTRSKPTDDEQLQYTVGKEDIDFQLQNIIYDKSENEFKLFGRTLDNRSVTTRVTDHTFNLYVGHKILKQGAYDEASLKDLEDNINEELRERANTRYKYKRIDDKTVSNVTLSLVQKKSYFNYSPNLETYLLVTYKQNDLLYDIKAVLKEAIEHDIKFFESNIKPTDQFLNDKGIYINGWVSLKKDQHLVQYVGKYDIQNQDGMDVEHGVPGVDFNVRNDKLTNSDLEYGTSFQSICGYSPNPNEAPDKKWEKVAPFRVLSLDAEMLNNGNSFPRAEQDPVVNICAYSNTYEDPTKQYLQEVLRHADPKKSRELRNTGRTNYDHCAAFIVGNTNDIAPDEFDPTQLPNAPQIPTKVWPSLRNELKILEGDRKYSKDYIVLVRKWNSYIESFREWLEAVGRKRARKVILDDRLFDILCDIKPRDPCKSPSKDLSQEEALLWEENIEYISSHYDYDNILKDDISTLGKLTDEYEVAKANDSDKAALDYGTIQDRWKLFRIPKKVYAFRTEEEMLRGFYNYVKQYDADVLTGYNVTGFDLSYFIKRVKVLDIRDHDTQRLISMGRIRYKEDTIDVKVTTTRAYGERRYTTVTIPGVDTYDFMGYVQKEFKLKDYRLAYVAEKYIGDTKNDVPYSAIPSLFKNNREKLTDYCLKDAELVLMLMNKLNNVNFLTSMSRAIGTIPIGRLFVDGQQAKVFASVYRFVRIENAGKIFPDNNPFNRKLTAEEEEAQNRTPGFSGAFVFPPKEKGLCKKLLWVFDYASLYPSIMIAYNLGHDVAGTLEHMLKVGVDVEKECYKTAGQYTHKRSINRDDKQHWYFIKPEKDGKNESALIGAIKKMLGMRGVFKKQLQYYDKKSDEYNKLWAAQLCWKILANSTYGACGVTVGKLAGVHVSAEVTQKGKDHLLELARELEREFGAVIHGGDTDSVFVEFPDIVRPEQMFEEVPMTQADGSTKMVPRFKIYEKFANDLVPPPMEIELEKLYKVSFWVAKKRGAYIEQLVEWDDIEEKLKLGKATLEFKGLETKRRDSCIAAQETIAGFLTKLLEINDENEDEKMKEATDFVRERSEKIVQGDIGFHEIVQSRQLSSSNYTNDTLPHLTICKKKRKRGEQVPELGTRIPFVNIATNTAMKASESVEDPDYVIEHGLQPDYAAIVEKKIRTPIERFTKLMKNGDKLNEMMFSTIPKHNQTQTERRKNIFTKKVRLHKVNLTEDDPMSRFVVRTYPCMSCGRLTKEEICGDCKYVIDWDYLLSGEGKKRTRLTDQLNNALSDCRKCMSINEEEEVLCANSSCSKYFPRKSYAIQLKKQEEHISYLEKTKHDTDVLSEKLPDIALSW